MKRNKLGILVVCLIILGIICGAMMQIYINKSAKNISQELESEKSEIKKYLKQLQM